MKIIIPSLIVACFIGILIAVFGFGSSDIATCGNQPCEDVIKDPENIEPVFTGEGKITGYGYMADTISIDDTWIQLSLVTTPPEYKRGYQEAKDFAKSNCPIGSDAKFVEDSWRTQPNRNGLLVGLVYCSTTNINPDLSSAEYSLNELLLLNSNTIIVYSNCSGSEFSQEDWAIEHGCTDDPYAGYVSVGAVNQPP